VSAIPRHSGGLNTHTHSRKPIMTQCPSTLERGMPRSITSSPFGARLILSPAGKRLTGAPNAFAAASFKPQPKAARQPTVPGSISHSSGSRMAQACRKVIRLVETRSIPSTAPLGPTRAAPAPSVCARLPATFSAERPVACNALAHAVAAAARSATRRPRPRSRTPGGASHTASHTEGAIRRVTITRWPAREARSPAPPRS
jgi:hypothetical protein